VDEFWLVADQKVVPFDGDLEDYRAWCAKSWQLHKQNNHAAAAVDKAPAAKKATASEIFEQKNLKQKVAKLEKKLTTLQEEQKQLQAWLASESAYAPDQKDALATAVDRNDALATLIAPLEEEWLLLSESLAP
jgi:ATP-binding cassette subfamily F protein 3